jgi:MoaA/NifB/PqqE/SkfB family radical SAM enzyme
MTYADLAKSMGVSFIQILEPRAVGHYKDKDVSLSEEQEKILDEFYFKMNYDKKYIKYPIVSYPGCHQRKIGCFASGNRSLYIDTDGDLHACPFCQTKMGKALSDKLDESIERMRDHGCHQFKGCNC